MENISQMSMLEVAYKLMQQKRTKQPIKNIIKEVLEIKGLDDEDGDLAAQLYVDITASSKFVYMGNEEWDLKDRQSLDEWDKDGSAFNSKDDEYHDEEENLDYEDEEEDSLDYDEEDFDEEENLDYDDEDEDEDDSTDDDSDDSETDDNGEPLERYSEDDEDFDEDKYNDYMDDFEDMYEK